MLGYGVETFDKGLCGDSFISDGKQTKKGKHTMRTKVTEIEEKIESLPHQCRKDFVSLHIIGSTLDTLLCQIETGNLGLPPKLAIGLINEIREDIDRHICVLTAKMKEEEKAVSVI